MKHFLSLLFLLLQLQLFAQDKKTTVVHVQIREEIAPSATRLLAKALDAAREKKADYVLLEMDTYGGLLIDADSMRKGIMNFNVPVIAFINKNAGSAGALISLACDSIYMSKGATIGSSTVVDGEGKVLPDKYQSYMRSIMRSTAESHGKDTLIENGDTTIRFRRDPGIAEAMVDERIAIPGVIDSGRIVAFTTSEAIEHGYCEAEANSVEDVMNLIGTDAYNVVPIKKTSLDKMIGFLAKPALQGVLMMIIFWGIFFELRTPGVGFPLAASVLAAMLYFAPLYLDGLAQNWEILLFVIGLILIGLEIFVIPGFGVAGVTGILLTVGSLILSLIRNVDFDFGPASQNDIASALMIVFTALVGFVLGAFLFGRGMTSSPLFKRLILSDTLKDAHAGGPSLSTSNISLIGESGIAHTAIRPMGKAKIDDVIYDVKSMGEFIAEGSAVTVISRELGYWVVEEIK